MFFFFLLLIARSQKGLTMAGLTITVINRSLEAAEVVTGDSGTVILTAILQGWQSMAGVLLLGCGWPNRKKGQEGVQQ